MSRITDGSSFLVHINSSRNTNRLSLEEGQKTEKCLKKSVKEEIKTEWKNGIGEN